MVGELGLHTASDFELQSGRDVLGNSTPGENIVSSGSAAGKKHRRAVGFTDTTAKLMSKVRVGVVRVETICLYIKPWFGIPIPCPPDVVQPR